MRGGHTNTGFRLSGSGGSHAKARFAPSLCVPSTTAPLAAMLEPPAPGNMPPRGEEHRAFADPRQLPAQAGHSNRDGLPPRGVSGYGQRCLESRVARTAGARCRTGQSERDGTDPVRFSRSPWSQRQSDEASSSVENTLPRGRSNKSPSPKSGVCSTRSISSRADVATSLSSARVRPTWGSSEPVRSPVQAESASLSTSSDPLWRGLVAARHALGTAPSLRCGPVCSRVHGAVSRPPPAVPDRLVSQRRNSRPAPVWFAVNTS